MKKYFVILALIGTGLLNAQVGVGTSTPKATLEVVALKKNTISDGILIPRLTRAEVANMQGKIEESTLIYVTEVSTGNLAGTTVDVDTPGFYYYKTDKWVKLSSSGSGGHLEKITENNQTGYRILGRNPHRYGNIGNFAVDLSYNYDDDTDEDNERGATGEGSFAAGMYSTASGVNSVAIGGGAASELNSVAIGPALAFGINSAAFAGATAKGFNSVAMGNESEATSMYATATGNTTKAKGICSFTMGKATIASGINSTATGDHTKANGDGSLTMGFFTVAEGKNSVAMGGYTKANGDNSVAMGGGTIAEGVNSVAMGGGTIAEGASSVAMGIVTIAKGDAQLVIGKYNKEDDSAAFLIGSGDENTKSNAFKVDFNGDIYSGGEIKKVPDYVFEKYYNGVSKIDKNYKFQSLADIEAFIKNNGHLPGYKSAKEIKKEGYINITETQLKNWEKIEELYLYVIEQESKIKNQSQQIEQQSKEIEELKKLVHQIIKNK